MQSELFNLVFLCRVNFFGCFVQGAFSFLNSAKFSSGKSKELEFCFKSGRFAFSVKVHSFGQFNSVFLTQFIQFRPFSSVSSKKFPHFVVSLLHDLIFQLIALELSARSQ